MSRLRHPEIGIKQDDSNNSAIEAEKAALAYIDYAFTGILQTDRNGLILRANPAAASITGVDIKKLPGSHIHALISETSAPRAKRHLALLDEQGISHTELKALHSDGRELIIEMASVEVEDGHFVHVFDDVTEQRHMVAEVERARASAESANRAKSAFLSSISHELRTPLNGIIGLGQLTLNGSLDDIQRDHIRKIVNSGQTLLRILNDLLDTARLESGQMQFESLPFSVSELFADLDTLAGQAGMEKNLPVRFVIDERIPPALMGDALRIGQCLRNLLGNAIKFTKQGEVRVEADIESRTKENLQMLRFQIIDTGIGMPQVVLERLCAPFSQAEASTARLYGGSGLGLYITRQLVQGMGGQLKVESEPGVGSRFTLLIPLIESSQMPVSLPVADPSDVPSDFRGCRLMIADDDSVNRIILEHWMQLAGIDAPMAEDGQELLQKIATLPNTPDLILMDVQMPVLDGLETTRRLREKGYTKPIIGLSAGVSLAEQEACLSSGMNDFIGKPIVLDELWGVLTRWLQPVKYADEADIDSAETRFMGNRDALARARAAFIACHANDGELLSKYLLTKDFKGISQLAHSLKGASSILGFSPLADSADALERAVHQGISHADLIPLIDQLAEHLRIAVMDARDNTQSND